MEEVHIDEERLDVVEMVEGLDDDVLEEGLDDVEEEVGLDAAVVDEGLEHFLTILQLRFLPPVASTKKPESDAGLAGFEVPEPEVEGEPGPWSVVLLQELVLPSFQPQSPVKPGERT